MKKLIYIARSLLPLYKNIVFRFFFGIILFFTTSLLIANNYIQDGYVCVAFLTIGMYSFIYYSLFSLIEIGVERMIDFHESYNSENSEKQPLSAILKNKLRIVIYIKILVNALFFYFFVRMILIPVLINSGVFK